MSKHSDSLWERSRDIAEKAIHMYVQNILTVEALTSMVICDWERVRRGEDQPSHAVLMRIAQRICSRELCSAYRSLDSERRNQAFDNLRRHLERSLLHTRYSTTLQLRSNAIEDVVHLTLEALHLALIQARRNGPDDPASFLKWTQTVLIRQAHAFLLKQQRNECLSLDALSELFVEQYVDIANGDPLQQVLLRELQQTLGDAILSMRNRRYRQVLIYTYIVGVDERELAQQLEVQVQDVYIWRHRALKSLRSKPEVMNTLRSLLE